MRALTRNLPWKLLALGASLVLWYVFAGEVEVATSLPVVVQYRNIPQDLEISSEPPERIFLKLRGPAARLRGEDLAQATVVLDLSSVAAPGEQTFAIDPETIGLPPGVHLLRAVPSQIRLTFERRAVRDVPVEVRYSGPPPPGYRLVKQQVSPASVRVVGPESRVARLEAVSTDAVDLSSDVGEKEFRVALFVGDPQVRFEDRVPVAVVRVTMEKIPQ